MEIDEETPYDVCKQLIREVDPMRFIFSFGNVQKYLDSEKVRDGVGEWVREEPDFEVKPWVVPEAMRKWKEENIDCRRGGRPQSLLIVGVPRSGKTNWAKSFG
jgi:hypothetical protein